MKLYFIFFALSLVLYSIHRPTAIYDIRTLAAADAAGNIPRILESLAETRKTSVDQVAQELNSRWQSYISLSQVIYPLFVALALMIFLRRRRLFFAEHLIFALHILAFLFLSFVIFWPAFLLFGIRTTVDQYTPAFLAVSGGSLIWTAVYLLLALRRAYGEGWVAATIKSILVFMTYMVTSMAFMSATLALAIAITRRAG